MKTEILLSGNSGNTGERDTDRARASGVKEKERKFHSLGNLEIACDARRKWWNTRKHGITFNFDLERPTRDPRNRG